MNSSSPEIDALIVGAGPVGLLLANECARRGLKWRQVETHSGQSEHSKALAIFPRTLEIFDMAGVAGPFLEVANRVTSVTVTTHDRRLATLNFEPEESPYPFIAMVPQDVTERLLVEQLAAKGGAVEYETTFLSATQQGDSVVATLEHKGQQFEIQSKFVVGCDGPHSTVRHLLNLTFEGAQYDDMFLLADIESTGSLPANELQLCPSASGPLAIFPMSANRRRIVATIKQFEGDAPSLELVQRLLKERGPNGIKATNLHWSSYFRIHHRQASDLRVGRIFIAGDAAHIHSPFGGQGMNTGLHDVWNLAWKLDVFLNGHGNERLLDSYSAERRPVIKSVIETTDFMTRALGAASPLAQAVRNTVMPMVSRLAPFQHAVVQRLSELGIAYGGSPIVDGPGERYIDNSMRGGKGILNRFLLLMDSGADLSILEAARQLSNAFPDLVETRLAHRKGITLVRPDGYVAYTGHDHEGAAALESVRSVLERQTS